MSRIGKKPIVIPQGVKVALKGKSITVEGPKGTLKQQLRPEVTVKREDENLIIKRKDESKRTRSFHGLYRNLIDNMIQGVTTGFTKVLLINGVGYRAELQNKEIVLNLGFSDPIKYSIPEGITVNIEANTRIAVTGADKQQVGQVSAEIRAFRPPEPYKGKGIRLENEYVKRKIGKAGIK